MISGVRHSIRAAYPIALTVRVSPAPVMEMVAFGGGEV